MSEKVFTGFAILVALLAIRVVLIFATMDAYGEEQTSSDVTKMEMKSTLEMSALEIERWKFHLTEPNARELTLVQNPILRWTNPSVGRVYGTVLVFTDEGCPQVIVSPYKWFAPYNGFEMECRSVTTAPVEGFRDGVSIWATKQPGIEWKQMPGNPIPAESPEERLRQMKLLAADFTANLIDTRSNGEGEDQQLRQMPRPVYRYQSAMHHVLEGGIFAYVLGTDPELFLLIEAVEDDGKSNWRYGLTRMNSDHLSVLFQNREVWNVPKITYETMRDPKQPYSIFEITSK